MKRLPSRMEKRRGITLAELMCAGLLGMLLLLMCASALVPAARVMRRLRRTSDAQMIAGGIVEQIRAEVEEAREYIKIDSYGDGGMALEFAHGDGCSMRIWSGVDGTNGAGSGHLLYRCCSEETGNCVEYAGFPEKFYMGLFLKLQFFPILEDGAVTNIKVTVQLTEGQESSAVICAESLIIDLRYAWELQNGVRVRKGLPLLFGGKTN